ncbi:MAG: hypothetical protein A2751_00715 [Candidatus Doudnabacteria bacterium RIFCSPHIGHO2_01_FULL_46_14]|uniref:Methyltransferase domain-containing protein n=1 Tax=Candidatus Doudnabacteria bacterium RIFCSPHIGHO2_01_FULL_46_14 TaxID=1817824 RepID=A0A1F5NN70_9BACT|nr:MAG: hypothetical protein A2751_00715 [Candidatus Doudnabacteria bacterium RIFCSPHIGHO2_01_FULL_46_14]
MGDTKVVQQLVDLQLAEYAESTLGHVDLSLEALATYQEPNSVVDLGCGTGQVGRAAQMMGTDCIVSIYAGQVTPSPDTPNLRQMNALVNIDLPSESVRLLFSRNGPHLWCFNEEQARRLFQEINRIITSDGEARFHCPWFGFVQLRIAESLKAGEHKQRLQGVWRQLGKHPTDWRAALNAMNMTEKKLERAYPYLRQARDESTRLLREWGYDIELVQHRKSPTDDKADYWCLQKTQ